MEHADALKIGDMLEIRVNDRVVDRGVVTDVVEEQGVQVPSIVWERGGLIELGRRAMQLIRGAGPTPLTVAPAVGSAPPWDQADRGRQSGLVC